MSKLVSEIMYWLSTKPPIVLRFQSVTLIVRYGLFWSEIIEFMINRNRQLHFTVTESRGLSSDLTDLYIDP